MDQRRLPPISPDVPRRLAGALLAAPCAGGVTTFDPSFEPGAELDVTERDAVTIACWCSP